MDLHFYYKFSTMGEWEKGVIQQSTVALIVQMDSPQVTANTVGKKFYSDG